jgi:hypothetical protein
MRGRKTRRGAAFVRQARKRNRGSADGPLEGLDPHSPEFAKEAHRQSLEIANSPSEADDQAFIDSISVWNHEE